MPTTSQFRIFESTDLGAPQLDGTSGSLIRVLDAVLCDGYGTKAPIGWLKPIPNESGSYTDGLMKACYQQPSGSGFTLMVNDGAPTGSNTGSGAATGAAGARAAWAVGWEYLLGMTGSGISNYAGTGSGQFPTPGLANLTTGLLNNGMVEWTKSNLITTNDRYWILYGDAYCFYLFVQHEWVEKDAYSLYGFGDFFSTKINTPDRYKCMLIGRLQTSTNASISIDPADFIFDPLYASYGWFVARAAHGQGTAATLNRVGDASTADLNATAGTYIPHYGLQKFSPDSSNTYDFSPIQLVENDLTKLSFRGRARGLYFPTGHLYYYPDGLEISGSNHYNGKIFRIVRRGNNNGLWAIEISPTVETNDY